MKKKLFSLLFLTTALFSKAQNVGIGTSAPQAKLHIVSPGDETVRLDATNPFLSLYSTGVYKGYFWKSPNSIELGSATGSNLPITFAPNGNQLMYIGTNGNVGIGTLNPNAPLGFPPSLGKKITLYPGATGDVGMAVQGNLFQIYSDNPSADIAFGYDQAGTITERMRIKANGNVGIGTNNPSAKLQVSGGDASLALFGPNSTYGAMLYVGASPTNQSTTLTAQVNVSDGNLHIDPAAGKNLYFGYFQQRDIYLNPNGGKVGIGNNNPGYQLDVSNRMRIRSGGNNSVSAGLWLNNNTNTETAFIGMEDDTHVGLFGAGTGWKFGMNTQTGALKINGTEGGNGQILRSNGAGSSPTWMNKPYVVWYTASGSLSLNGSNLIVNITNINGQTLSLNEPSYISYQFTISLFADNGAFGGGSAGIVNIQFLDGASNVISSASSQFNVANLISSQILIAGAGDMPAGTFTIVARVGRNSGGGNTYDNFGSVSGIPVQRGQLIVQIFPK